MAKCFGSFLFTSFVLAGVATARPAQAQLSYGQLTEAVKRSTLDQPGTKPFHLKATLAPSYQRENMPDLTGSVEIWWLSPTHYRRELHCASFSQTEIVDGLKIWQSNRGDYLPKWLNAIARTLIQPVVPDDLAEAKSAEVRDFLGTTYFQWMKWSTDGTVRKAMGASLDLNDKTGLLRLDSEGKENYREFHNRTVAQSVTGGSPEVRATIVVLEDLPSFASDFLDPSQPGADPHPIRVLTLDEMTLRRNLQPAPPPVWPVLRDGPLEGVLTADINLDRSGHPRECKTPISDNPGVNAAARDYICGLVFQPVLVAGEPVQVLSRFTMPFKTTRPAGMESFAPARTYFEQGRRLGFPSTGAKPYVLRAEFHAKAASGLVETGRYEDVFMDDQHWRREAWFGASHLVRSQSGTKRYLVEDGPEAGLLRLVLRATEPIPALDTFVESDWRISSIEDNGSRTIRVFSGYESPDGKPDPQHARGYWFLPSGQLVKTYGSGLETRRTDFQDFNGLGIARAVGVYTGNGLALKVNVTEISSAPPSDLKSFEVKGHEWKRQFTDEVR